LFVVIKAAFTKENYVKFHEIVDSEKHRAGFGSKSADEIQTSDLYPRCSFIVCLNVNEPLQLFLKSYSFFFNMHHYLAAAPLFAAA
jgi:hypothetical protein